MNSFPYARLNALLRFALLTSTALVGATSVRAQSVVMGDFIFSYGDSGPTDYFSVGAGSWDVKGGLLVGDNTDGDSPARLLIAPGVHFTTGSGGYIGQTLHPSEYFGAVSVDGGTWINNGGLYVGDAGHGMLMISNGGTVTQEGGLGTVTMANQAGSKGTLAIGLTRDFGLMDHGEFGAPGTLNAARVAFGQGDGKLLFHHSFTHLFGQEYTFAPSISGNGTIEQRAGTTRLGGNNSGFTGQALVSGGRLILPTSSAIGSSVLKIDSASVELADGLVLSNPIEIYNDISTLHVPTGTAIQTGVISDFGSLNKSGTGTLVLAGANTFTGYVRLNEGTLEVQSDQSLGGNSSYRPPVFIQDGTTLRAGSSGLTLANDMWLVGNGTIDTQGHELTLSGKIGAAGGLIKSGSGLLRLTGSNTYAGNTTIRQGTLAVEKEANLAGAGSPALVLAGGTLRFEGYSYSEWLTPTTLVGTGGFEVASPGHTVHFLKPLDGSGIFTKSGPGTLVLASNTFAIDRFDVQDGILALGTLGALGPGTGLHLGAKGTFIHGHDYTTQSFAGGLLSGEAGSLFRIGSHSRLAITGPGHTTFSGSIADESEMFPYQVSGSLDKSGTGMLTLAGNNTYTGDTQIMEGTLRLVGDGSIAASDWVNMHPTGTLDLATGGKTSLRGLSGIGGSVILSNTDLEVGTSGMDRSYNGSIRGTGGLIKAGAGGWTLGGPVSISGNLTVAGGTLDLTGAGSISSPAIHVSNIGKLTFDRADGARSIESLWGTGTVQAGQNDLTIGEGNFGGSIRSSSRLIKAGDGVLTLSGLNSIQGGTIVEAGTLSILGSVTGNVQVRSGATLSGARPINGHVAVDAGATLAGLGTSPLGMSSLHLDAASSVDATFRTAGIPVFFVNGNLTVAGALRINPASILSYGTFALFDSTGTLANNGMALASAPAGYQPGSFSLKTEAGKISLVVGPVAGDQHWKGGSGIWFAGSTWLNPGSSLQVGWSGNTAIFGGTSGQIEVQGTQTFSNLRFESNGYVLRSGSSGELAMAGAEGGINVSDGATATLDLPVTGGGKLAKSGAGTLVLSGSNSYSGGTRIEAGTLVGSVSNLGSGDVENDGTLELRQATDGTLAARISGSGGLHKTGAGVLNLTGTSTYTGGTLVQDGRLKANGSLASSVTVASGGILGGSGQIGGLEAQSGGTVAPGNSIGTLHVNGPVSFRAGSTYEVEVDAVGNSDRIVATGQATIAGGTVQVLAENGSYKPSTTYKILTANGGVSGAFSRATSNLAFLTPSLGYEPNSVVLTLSRKTDNTEEETPPKPLRFSSVAQTRNQFNTAEAVEALGNGNRLFDAVVGQSAGSARQSFDALSGEVHGSAAGVALTGALRTQDLLLNRMRSVPAPVPVGQAGTVAAAYAADRPASGIAPEALVLPSLDPRLFALWGEGFGSWGQIRNNGNAAGVDTSTGGFVIGAEARLDDTYTLGIAGGFSRTTFDVDGRLSSGSDEATFGAIYGTAQWGAVNLRSGASYVWHNIDTTRTITFPGFADQTNASYNGSTLTAFAEVGYAFNLKRVTLEPFLGASVIRLHTDSFVENGSTAALTGFSRTHELATTTLGLRAEARISNDLPLTLRGMVGWRRVYGDIEPDALLAFAGGASAFAVSGVPIDRDALVAEAGLDWQINRDMTLAVAYSGQIGERAQEHALKGNFTWRFKTH